MLMKFRNVPYNARNTRQCSNLIADHFTKSNKLIDPITFKVSLIDSLTLVTSERCDRATKKGTIICRETCRSVEFFSSTRNEIVRVSESLQTLCEVRHAFTTRLAFNVVVVVVVVAIRQSNRDPVACRTAAQSRVKASSLARSLVVLYSPRSNPFSGNPCLNSPSTLASRRDLPARLYRRISQPSATVNRRIPRPRNNIRARRFRRPKLICRPTGKFPCKRFGFLVEHRCYVSRLSV